MSNEGVQAPALKARPRRAVAGVLALAAAAACLLCGYEFIRSASQSLYVEFYTADRLPAVMALMPLGVIAALYVYGVLLSRLGPERALLVTSGLSAAIMVGCYFGVSARWAPAAGVLYILREAYIVVVLEQYWSLIDSVLRTEQARALNGPVTGIASLGSIMGAQAVHSFAVDQGTEVFILLTAASLVPAFLLSWLAYALAGEPQPAPEEAGGRQGHLALGLFARSPYLVWLALLIGTTQVVSSALDIRFTTLTEAAFPEKDARSAYLGGFYRNVNVAAALMQFVAAPALLRALPLRAVHTAIPCVHLCAALALLVSPSLGAGALALLLFKTLDYSLFRASKEILYIPLSFDVRYRAKEVIDAFVYRFAKGGLGLLLTVYRGIAGALPAPVCPSIAMGAALVWLPLVLRLTRPVGGRGIQPGGSSGSGP